MVAVAQPRIAIPSKVSGTANFNIAPAMSPITSLSQLPSLFTGNIYAGLPTSWQGTPYASTIQAAKQYLYNPQQLRTIANQQTGAQINAGLQASYANQAAEQAQLQAMQNRSAGLAAALGSFGSDYASSMQNAYDQAAQTMAAVGPGVVQQ